MNNIEFRKRLYEITEERVVEQHKELVSNLTNEYPHSIILKSKKPDRKKDNYNCFTFAFNLTYSSEYAKIAATPPYNIFANSDFGDFLLRKGFLKEKKWDDKNNGDIIIYFDGGVPKHAGKIHSDKIISKWGTGHLWEHDIYEVPISYGNEYRIFSSLAENAAITAFSEYAKSKGMTAAT